MGRRITIAVGGLATTALAAFAVYLLMNWREVETEYHLRELTRDPDHLARILDRPEESPAQAAVRRYIERAEGAGHLLRLYVSALFESSSRGGLQDTDQRVLSYHEDSPYERGPVVRSVRSDSPSRWVSFRVNDGQLSILHRLMHEREIANYDGVELQDYEGFVFQVVRGPWVAILTDIDISQYRADGGYVCVVRKKGADPAVPDPGSVPELLRALTSKIAAERKLARNLLARMGCDPDDPVPYLVASIKSRRQERRAVIRDVPSVFQDIAIEGLSAVDARHVPLLLRALEDDDAAVRHRVLLALMKRKLPAETAIPIYLTASRDEDVTIRDAAVVAIEDLGPEALPALVGLLESGTGRMRFQVLNAIGRFGTLAKWTIPAILEWVEGNSNPFMRKKVAEVTLQIDPDNQHARAIAHEVDKRETVPSQP